MKKITILFTLIFGFVSGIAFAQEKPKIKKSEFLTIDAGAKEAWKSIKTGNKFYKKNEIGAYRVAAMSYATALEYNDTYAPLLYKAGVSEVMISSDKLALRHLTDANDFSSSVADDIMYWIALSKHHLNRFSEARSDYDEAASTMNEKNKKKFHNAITLRLTQCDNGTVLLNKPDKAVAQLLTGEINTEYPEIAPVFAHVDSSLFFGSKRWEGNSAKRWGKDLDPCADIFYCKANNGKFTGLQNESSLNKSVTDYPAAISMSNDVFYVSRKNKKIIEYYKKSENSKFFKRDKIFKKVISLSFSSDSSQALICTRKGPGVQGYDIMICKRVKGKYSDAQSLGNLVNTQYDEVMASFGANDTVIYFASNGQNSVGGFDIMKTSFHNGKWGKPENLGLGINSGTDENYFQLAPGETRIGYYSSKQQGGAGDYDIYKVLLLNEPLIQYQAMPHYELAADLAKEPILNLEDPEVIKTMRLTVVKGKVTDYDETKNLYARITITDNSTNQITQQIMTDSETGEYTVMLASGKNYAMTVTCDGYLFHSENFDIPKTSSYQEIRKDIKLLPMDPGSKVVLNNVFFDTGKSDLRPESFGELNRLAEVFRLYPNLVIEVSGHTDSQGNRQHNITLSLNRANAVRDYLLAQGVNPGQVVAKGYGPDQPRDTNATAEGRQNNRRVEAKILSN